MGTLSAVLFGATRQSVLRLLLTHSDQRFYLRQVIRMVEHGSGLVQREIEDLTGVGVLLRTVEGRQAYYQANSACPIFDELRGLIRKTFGVADVVRTALRLAAERITLAFVFGSMAAGQERQASDIDLFLVGDRLSTAEVARLLREA